MADNDHDASDWQAFVDHVSTLHRRLGLRRSRATTAIHNELDSFVDPHAYVQALFGVIDAHQPGWPDLADAGLIAQRKTENPHEKWRQREIDALRRADESRMIRSDVLQRFAIQQDRVSEHVVLDADRVTREWIDSLVEETWGWEQYLSELLARAQDASLAESLSSSGVVSSREDGAAGSSDEEDEEDEDEDEQDPAAAGQSAGGPGSSSGGKKRSRERDDDHNGEQPSKRSSRPDSNPGPVIREEPESSNGIRLNQMDPLEPEVDPVKDFNLKWQALREQWDEKDKPTWERLYSRAHRLVEANEPAIFPEDLSATAMAKFRTRVNTALEKVLGWDWEEYIEIIKNAEDGRVQRGDLERAELLREASMQRAHGGQSPVWPPVVQKDAPPPPDSPISFDVRTHAKTAEALDSDLIREGTTQPLGEWQYLTTFSEGTTGQAQLWMGVRSDDHGTVIERVVVKYFSIASSYANDYMWISNDYTGNERWLRERAMHAQLSSVGSSSGIVQYRGATSKEDRGEEKWIQRIYMEYCPHGDLMDLLCEHAKTDGRSPRLDEDSQPIPQVRIPTRALWSFFKDLAAAACIMESGYNPLGNDYCAADDWEEIIHRDLKPGNIFLAAPLTKTSRGIPVCKLGGFGLSVPREYEPLRNPEDMRNPGTPGWKAPEFNRYPPDFEVSHELSSATDIWAIGRVILALMELPIGRLPVVRYHDENEGRVDVQAKAQLVATHGEELYGLVEKCLEPTSGDRIRAQHLLRAIDRQINNLSVPLPLELEDGDVLEHVQDLRWAT